VLGKYINYAQLDQRIILSCSNKGVNNSHDKMSIKPNYRANGAKDVGPMLDSRPELYHEFREKYLYYAGLTFGTVSRELEAEADIPKPEAVAPEEGLSKWELRMYTVKMTKEIDAYHTIKENRFRMYHDLIIRMSDSSRSLVKRHEEFAAAEEAKSPRILWKIINTTHVNDQFAGALAITFKRAQLFRMIQGSKEISKHAAEFQAVYNQLVAMKDELTPTKLAAEMFLASIGSQYLQELDRWSRDGTFPVTLEAAIRRVVDYSRHSAEILGGNDKVDKRSYDQGPAQLNMVQQRLKDRGRSFKGKNKKRKALSHHRPLAEKSQNNFDNRLNDQRHTQFRKA
jgi:hypothetical protein